MTVSLFSAILGLLTALPALLSLISRFALWLHTTSDGNTLALVKKLTDVFDQVQAAKTEEDKTNAAKNLSDLIGSFRK